MLAIYRYRSDKYILNSLQGTCKEKRKKEKLTSNPLKQCLSQTLIEEIGLDGKEMCTIHKAVVSENSTLINSGTPELYMRTILFMYV